MKTRVQWGSALCAALLLSVCLPPARAASGSGLYEARLSGSVSINGQRQSAGSRTVTAGDLLVSGARGGATIVFGPGELVSLDQNSAVRMLPAEDGVRLQLERGRMQVSSSNHRLQDVRIAGRSTSVQAPSGGRSQYVVSRLPQGDFVYARLGNVALRELALNVTMTVPEGRVAMFGSEAGAPPQGAPDHAGKIAAAIPKGYIVRASQKTPDNPGDEVRWNDEIVTEASGRSRVSLDDGSILSVGSSSNLKVLKHDAAAQQTELELTTGKIRAQVNKITKPNGSFTVKTPTAVAGVVGTDFYIETDGKKTRVTVLEGIVKLTPIGAAVAVSLAAGQTSVSSGGSASSPASATGSQMSAVTSSTSVASGVSAAAATIPTVAIVSAAVVPAAVISIVLPNIDQTPVSPTSNPTGGSRP